jgi:hypothetical protein
MKRLEVGQETAVDILVEKIHDLLPRIDAGRVNHRLHLGVDRARRRYREVRTQDGQGFYHGLITGYAIAVKVFQGKVAGVR